MSYSIIFFKERKEKKSLGIVIHDAPRGPRHTSSCALVNTFCVSHANERETM